MRLRLLCWCLCLWPAVLAAHPMGTLSINRTATVEASPRVLTVRYLVDFAEIPSSQEFSRLASLQNPGRAPFSLDQYGAQRLQELQPALSLSLDGQTLTLTLQGAEARQVRGEWGLPNLVLLGVFRAPLPAEISAPARVLFRDDNFSDAPGWRSLRVMESGAVALSEVEPAHAKLSPNEPFDPLLYQGEPPDESQLSWRMLPAQVSPSETQSAQTLPARAAPVAGDSLAWLFQRGTQGGWWFWLALLGSAFLGAGHALAPGHGKTLVAAYLVGARGTIRHALFLGGVVTITHVASVFALGAVALWLSAYAVPARLFSWLGLASGAGVVLLGLVMLRERVQRFYAAPTDEPREEDPPKEKPRARRNAAPAPETLPLLASSLVSQKETSANVSPSPLASQKETATDVSALSPLSQKEAAAPPTKATNPGSALTVASVSALSPLSQKETASASKTSPPEALRVGQLIGIGLAGGAVPCPSALVVLLAAVSAGEISFGMSLIVAFSLGLALVLVALGILAVRARDWFSSFSSLGRSWRALPVGSALLIVSLGTAIAINAAREAHLL